MPRRAVIAVLVAASALGPLLAHERTARADPPTRPVTNHHYALELANVDPLADAATIALGGAVMARLNGSSGTLYNASAAAVRAETDNGSYHFDHYTTFLTTTYATDYENNGSITNRGKGTQVLGGGLGLRYHEWGFAITATLQSAPVATGVPLAAEALSTQATVARFFERFDLAVGAALHVAEFELKDDCLLHTGIGCAAKFATYGVGGAIGATWVPHAKSYRAGLDFRDSIDGDHVSTDHCEDPARCNDYITPERLVTPWRLAGGVAYRFAPSAWNQQVLTPWRDEHAVTVAADLDVFGSSKNAYGIEAFGVHELQRAGEHPGVSPRAGVEWEWLPGRLRLRGGGYWEPARFEGVGGRMHGTAGVEVRVFQFGALGPRRGKLTISTDLAERYRNIAVAIGFWR